MLKPTLLTALVIAGSSFAQRQPLPIAGWEPRPIAVTDAAPPQPAPERKTSAPTPPPAEPEHVRRVALTMSVGAVAGSPSLELEVAPFEHVSFYGAAEASILNLGVGGQLGVRVRPMKYLVGPFLDVHVRFSRYAGMLLVSDSSEETGSPGVMGGVSLVSQGGFVFSAGLGVSLLAHRSHTTLTVKPSGGYIPFPVVDSFTRHELGPVPEVRLNLGYAF